MDLIIDQKQGLNGQRKSKVTFTRQGRVRTEAVIYVWFVLWRKFGGINSCVTPVKLGKSINVVMSSQQLDVLVWSKEGG